MGNTSHGARSVVPFRNFDQELKHPGIWEADQSSASAVDNSRDNLASLYRPPFAIMLQGPFEKVTKPHKNDYLLYKAHVSVGFKLILGFLTRSLKRVDKY